MYQFFSKSLIILLLTTGLSALAYADTVWIDVRSVLENKMDSIEGDINIPHENILQEVTKLYPDKETDIHVYCRSGGRAGKALTALEAAGYTHVKNAGSIEDARKERHLENK